MISWLGGIDRSVLPNIREVSWRGLYVCLSVLPCNVAIDFVDVTLLVFSIVVIFSDCRCLSTLEDALAFDSLSEEPDAFLLTNIL